MDQNQQDTSLFGMSIDGTTRTHLAEAARWASFLAIVGFIVCGLVVVFGIFAGAIFSSLSGYRSFGGSASFGSGFGAAMAVVYILLALLYFFPCLFLFRFAKQMKAALATNEQESLNASFQNLKAMFRFVGILTIIIIALYGLIFIISIITAATAGF